MRYQALIATLLLAAAGPAAGSELGVIDFPNSGAAAAQHAFVEGVLLLHSFEYEDAREAFQRAQEIDPAFALAHWGEAMTHNHPLWRRQNQEAALAALAEYGPDAAARSARAPTARERGFLEAVDVLFGEGTVEQRNEDYERAMGELYRSFPTDLEAQSFYALSILGTAGGTRDFATYMRAAAEAEEVFAANPRHPGAAHYLIHSYDDPVHAPLGLRAARVYADIAPAATHAQHMISHIYIALGRWAEAGAANEKSVAVSEERARRKGLAEHHRSHHALHWLQYSYLQEGRVEEAATLLETMARDCESAGTPGSRWYLAHMRAGQFVETGGRAELPPAGKTEGAGITARAVDTFVEVRGSLRRDDRASARRDLEALQALLGRVEEEATAADQPPRDSERERRAAAVLALELEALVLLDDERTDEALSLLQRATELEDSLPLEYGPPEIVKPSHELRGEVLLELGRADEAQAQFEEALRLAPRRALSLAGLARAAAATGDRETAARAEAELAAIRKSIP